MVLSPPYTGVLVGAVGRATVLHDAQAPGSDLLLDPVVEEDHTIGNVFLQTLPGQSTIAALAGND
jgi:hypothetical protein